MTRNRSSRGRNRGRRGRPAGINPDAQQAQEGGQATVVPAEGVAAGDGSTPGTANPGTKPPTPADASRSIRDGGRQRDSGPPPGGRGGQVDSRQASGDRSRDRPTGSRGGSGSRPGNPGSRNRRRPQRRPTSLLPAPMAVLRDNAPVTPPVQAVEKRSLSALGDASELTLGCPMLCRTRLQLPVTGNQNAPRCSLGWAVHSEAEVVFCLHTPDVHDCWKANPDRRQALQELLTGESSAAD